MVALQTLTYRHPEFSQYREPVHANYKHAIVDDRETGTLVLNKKSTPCIRVLKSVRTQAIHGEGLMAPDELKGSAMSISTAAWKPPLRWRDNRRA
jgi:hypothetical protein